MSTDTQAEAFKAYLAAAAKAPAYDIDEIRALATLPPNYVEVYLARRAGGEYRLDGSRDVSLRRLSTRVVSKTITNARLLEDRIVEAFTHKTVDLGDAVVQVDYEAGGGAFERDDGGFYSDLTDWTFSL